MPTLASLCNLKNIPTDMDGIDQSNMLKVPNTKSKRNSAFWKYGNQWVVRKGKWKLMGYPKDTSHKKDVDFEKDALFLTNLEEDVSEMENLAAQYPEIVKELLQKYVAWEFGSENDIPKKTVRLQHLGINKQIKANSTLHPSYKNINILLDGKQGYADFSSGQWIGEESKSLEFLIDLEQKTALKEISIGYLHSPSDYIFAPKALEIEFSDDGETYGLRKKVNLTEDKINKKNRFMDTLSVPVQLQKRFLKIKIEGIGICPKNHKGAGSPAWFFIDEIIIK
jgi:hypothetical protein